MNTMESPRRHDRSDDTGQVRGRRLCVMAGVLGVASLALPGCSSYRPPTVSVVDAALIDSNEEGTVMKFTINAVHDNDNPLPLRETRYVLELNGKQVFSGVRSAQCTLSRFGEQQFTIPAVVPAAQLAELTGENVTFHISGTLTYITPGAFAELLFDTGVSRPSVGFSQEGTLDMSATMTHGAKVGMIGMK